MPSKIFRKTLLPSRVVLSRSLESPSSIKTSSIKIHIKTLLQSRSLEKPFFHQDKFYQDPYKNPSSIKIFRKALLPSRQVLSRSKGENPSSIKKEHEAFWNADTQGWFCSFGRMLLLKLGGEWREYMWRPNSHSKLERLIHWQTTIGQVSL